MTVSHEDIRYKVISELRSKILSGISNIRINYPREYQNLRSDLDQYENIILNNEDIPLIIKNEKIIPGVGIPDVEIFGGKLVIEVKLKLNEFRGGFDQLNRYLPYYPLAEYAIITNFDNWEFYEVIKGRISNTNPNLILQTIIEDILLKGAKLILITENVRNVFKPIILQVDTLQHIFRENNIQESALFKAYNNIIINLYGKSEDKFVQNLFLTHTIMQMIVSSFLTVSFRSKSKPVNACTGNDLDAEIVLPYLKWWIPIFENSNKQNNEDKLLLDSLCNSIYSKTILFNWNTGSEEDIFRELYEILITTEIRRKMGEYYTPYWLVELMVDSLFKNVDAEIFKEKTVLDPFCGSGTFLVATFKKKLKLGDKPENAIGKIIGFDINPLAVSIARAELMIAYRLVTGNITTPLIFNVDSASFLFKKAEDEDLLNELLLNEIKTIKKKIGFVKSPIASFTTNNFDFAEVLKIEMILRTCFREVARINEGLNIKEILEHKMKELKEIRWEGALIKFIIDTLSLPECIEALTKLIKNYGNGVWAVAITSLFAPYIISIIKVDYIITNPPWILLTNISDNYGEFIRNQAKISLKTYSKIGQIISASDISSILLDGCIRLSNNDVSFLMPENAVLVPNSAHGLGKLLTYSVIKNYEGELTYIGYDVFEHGNCPCIVITKKKKGTIISYSLDNIKFSKPYTKNLRSSDINYSLIKMKEPYKTYIQKIINYTKEQSKDIKLQLDLESVIPKGEYIMGIYGGEKKKGSINYAGLIFTVESFDRNTSQYTIKLSNTNSNIKIPSLLLKPHWKKFIHASEIYPFYFDGAHNILLSSESELRLKEFLNNQILSNITQENEKEKVIGLVNELKQPNNLTGLNKNKFYVIYRGKRTFVSFVLNPNTINSISEEQQFDIVISTNCAYIICKDETQAYYYSSILNYLTYKVIISHKTFLRDIYLRPLIAIREAELEWANKKWQVDVSNLGKILEQESKNCLIGHISKGMQVKKTYDLLLKNAVTNDLILKMFELIDNNVNLNILMETLSNVCK